MSHLYKTSEWESASGRWYVNDLTDVTSVASKWYTPARMLNMDLTAYIQMLKDTFHASNFSYDKDVLLFSFDSQDAARKYKNWINKEARNRKYIV